MISPRHKCIFIHIPKAAGQSVESVFVELNELTWANRAPLLLKPNCNPQKGPPRLAHLKAHEYIDLGYITADTFNQYFSFSFVRNPWARLVSEFNYRRRHGDIAYQQSFKAFVLSSFPTPDKDDYSKSKDYYRHIIPQCNFLYNDNGKCLVDFIGRFETLQQDFNIVCRKLGLSSITLPHKNKTLTGLALLKQKILLLAKQGSTDKHYSEYYDSETKQFVADYYAEDITLFGYSFELKQG